MQRSKLVTLTMMVVLIASSVPGPTGSAATITVNRPPDAQAGPAPIVVDGGPDDLDGTKDGVVAVRLDGTRTTDPDNSLENDITCTADDLIAEHSEEEINYYWYEGHDVDTSSEDPIATGSEVKLSQRSLGLKNYTLETEDKCGETDTDLLRGMFVNETGVVEKEWTFEAGEPGAVETESLWRVTDGCDVTSEGNYLAFNHPSDCTYDTDTRLEGNATFKHDLGEWYVLGLEFDTLWDTRDDYVEDVQDHIKVEASLDHGSSWTPGDLTFNFTRGDHEENSSWVRAAGIFDLQNSVYRSGDVHINFTFDTGTSVHSGDLGWLIDNVRLVGLKKAEYEAPWGNQTYTEIGDPLARTNLTDEDGDGFAELEPVNFSYEEPTGGPIDNLTDEAIMDAMNTLNLTDADIRDDINTTLGWNSSFDDEREAAFNALENNTYMEAEAELEGTAADITYYCDIEDSNHPGAFDWAIGIPASMNCDWDNKDDIELNTRPWSVQDCGTDIDDISMSLDKIGEDSGDTGEVLWGLAYRSAGGFLDGDGQGNDAYGSFSVENLCSDTTEGQIIVNGIEMDPSEELGLFEGEPRGNSGNTLEAVLDGAEDDFRIDYSVEDSSGPDTDLILKIPRASNRENLEVIQFTMNLDNGRSVQGYFCWYDRSVENRDGCDDYPVELYRFHFGYSEINKGAGGTAYEVRFHLEDESYILRNSIWHWSVKENGEPQITFHFNGMPNKTWIRLDPGTDSDIDEIASIDVTRKDGNDRYRDLHMDTHIQGSDDEKVWNVKMQGDHVLRYRFAGATKHPEPGVDKFTELTAYLPYGWSQAFAEGGEGSWTTFDSWTTHDGTRYNWDYYVLRADCGPTCPQIESDPLPDGDVYYVHYGLQDYRSYHLDTRITAGGDECSGLEYDEIGDTGTYPCAFTDDNICA